MSSLILRNTFNNRDLDFFDNFFGGVFGNDSLTKVYDAHKPQVKETDNDYQIVLAAPGIKKENFDIQVKDNKITICPPNTRTEDITYVHGWGKKKKKSAKKD